MTYKLAQMHGDYDRVERRFEAAAFAHDDRGGRDDAAYVVADRVLLAFDITKEDHKFHLVGNVDTTLELTCGRCLDPFRLPVDAEFDLRYLPRAENTGEGERGIQEDDLTTAYYADDLIDLGQLMAEQFHLALPMKPLCSQSCRGLCPHCGTNLNTGSCSCRSTWADPRFAALKSLLNQK